MMRNDSAGKVSTLGLLDKSPNHVCHICAKSFARRDVLRRHARHQHGEAAFQKTSPRSRRKSCLRCALHKVKCTRESTCQECGKSGLLCQYNFEPSSTSTDPKSCDNRQRLGGDQIPPSSPKRPRLQLEEFRTPPGLQLTPAELMRPQKSPSLDNHPSPEWTFTWSREFGSDIDAPTVQTMTGPQRDGNDITRTNEKNDADSHALFTPLRHDSGLITHPGVGLERSGSDHMAPEHWGLLFDMEDHHDTNLASRTTSDDQLPELSDGAFPDFTIMPEDLATVGAPPHQTSGTWLPTRQPLLGDREGLQTHKGPADSGIAETQSPLHEAIYASISGSAELPGTEDGGNSAIEAEQSLALRIHRVLQQNSLGQIGLPTDVPASFPSSVQLSAFWDLYFVHFDKHCPILHRHLVNPMSCSPLIAAVVTVVGANYADTAHSRLFHQQGASKLCALLQTSLGNERNDGRAEGSVLAAVCILLCQAIRSRRSDQAQLLTTLLHGNIAYLEKMGLFQQQNDYMGRLNRGRTIPVNNSSPRDWMAQLKKVNDLEMHHQWRAWVKEETSRRLAWAYLTYNYLSAAFLQDRIPPDPEPPNLQMPCEDIMWEAGNARAWSTGFPWLHNPQPQLPFRATLRGLLHQNVALQEVSRFGRLVCAALIHYELCRGSSEDESRSKKSILQLVNAGGTEQLLRLAADLADSFKRDPRSQL
ncbi:hypothetical protein AYL99_07484 [Fonsecaea erecta]|uniref:C2H2-type domain-containing protein n=1 Tax=Fonsecaea erecta TaxID=1367422 RepID=A0A178ZF31_9EURO|nr:hypothetical protein AYL99_07484 [Fonsecaea erecta]OAP58394.1 hypothetical protein AYL99_07484 [Fonsecaea erecta]